MDGVAGFAVNHTMDGNIGFLMRGPASVFTAELAAIRMATDHIENKNKIIIPSLLDILLKKIQSYHKVQVFTENFQGRKYFTNVVWCSTKLCR
jgi:hypothetical protein